MSDAVVLSHPAVEEDAGETVRLLAAFVLMAGFAFAWITVIEFWGLAHP